MRAPLLGVPIGKASQFQMPDSGLSQFDRRPAQLGQDLTYYSRLRDGAKSVGHAQSVCTHRAESERGR